MARLGVGAWLLCADASVSAQTRDQQLARGRYIATAGDCFACHTAPGGRDYAGGLAIKSPVGTIYASNITPSKAHDIGRYFREQFAGVLRRGIRADVAHLYPAMPHTYDGSPPEPQRLRQSRANPSARPGGRD